MFPSSGNVGIGIVSPAEKLHIYGTGAAPSLSSNTGIVHIGNNVTQALDIGADPVTPYSMWLQTKRSNNDGTSWPLALNPLGGNVGIGTTNPGSKLTIVNGINPIVDSFNSATSLTLFGSAINSRSDPAVQQLLYLHQPNTGNGGYSKGSAFGIGLSFWEDPGNNYPRTRIDFRTTGRTTDTIEAGNTVMSLRDDGNVGIGTTNPSQKLSVNGTVRAKKVIVDTGWSDYVFADDYRLASLSEVESHIKAEKHLPGIPSAQEVVERGISLGEMQSKLLAKIEELTLHVIAQEKRMAQLESENSVLRRRVQTLEEEN